MGQTWWINEPPPRLVFAAVTARRSGSNPWCNAVDTLGITAPLFATHYPWLGGLPVHESSRRAVYRAIVYTVHRRSSPRVHTGVYSYNARSIRLSSGGLMIGLDCLVNMGESRVPRPTWPTPVRCRDGFLRRDALRCVVRSVWALADFEMKLFWKNVNEKISRRILPSLEYYQHSVILFKGI